MNRREAIKTACVAVVMPSEFVLATRVCSVENHDHGHVYIDGHNVKAIACCPDEGWAECFTDENGRAIGVGEPLMVLEGQPITARVYGQVRFEPRE